MYETESWEYHCPYLTCWKQRASAVNSPESPRVSPAGSWTAAAAAFPSVQSSPYPFPLFIPCRRKFPRSICLTARSAALCLRCLRSSRPFPQPAGGAGMCERDAARSWGTACFPSGSLVNDRQCGSNKGCWLALVKQEGAWGCKLHFLSKTFSF